MLPVVIGGQSDQAIRKGDPPAPTPISIKGGIARPEFGRFRLFIKNTPKPNLGKKYSGKYSRNTPAEYFQPEFIAALEYPYSTTKFALPSNVAGNSRSVEDTTSSQLPPFGPQTQSLI
jgi:hypothetical protein